jgi:uncharacterized ferritin-like protein (DUF455 family)
MDEVVISFFHAAEAILQATSISQRVEETVQLGQLLRLGQLDLSPTQTRVRLTPQAVQFPDAPKRIDPRQLPRRKLITAEGRIAFLHALAHIEFTAITLAIDIAYRFPDMPDRFRSDWIEVAVDEARHFGLLSERLALLGAAYGDLPAHHGLWELAVNTSGDVLDRLALIPRFMEARGLDVTPGTIERLDQLQDQASIDVLTVIYDEEIGHVSLGSHWFKWVCSQRSLDHEPTYFALLHRYELGSVRGPFNRDARLRAGFSGPEIDRLEIFDPSMGIPS